MTYDIPDYLAHLPVDVRWKRPRPDTTGELPLGQEDLPLRLECAVRHLCSVCGLPLGDPVTSLTGSGYGEMTDRVFLDGPLHDACARAAMTLCPHIARGKAIWFLLELYACDYDFQTADPARITGGERGLNEQDEQAQVWSAPGAVVDCAEPRVRWCILPHYAYSRDAIRVFEVVVGIPGEIELDEVGELDGDAAMVLDELFSRAGVVT